MVKITETLLKEIFKKTYLDLVAFEVRFPTDLTIQKKIPEFQQKIKNKFSVYSEGFSIPIPFQANIEKSYLINYAFKDSIDDMEIYLNNYSVFGLRTKNYPNFKSFSDTFFDVITKFAKLCDVNRFTRLGLRYINIIHMKKSFTESNRIKNSYFHSLISKNCNKYNFENQHIDLKYKSNNYEIHKQFIFRKNPDNLYEVVIDLDNSYRGEMNINEDFNAFKTILNDIHNLIKTKFFEMIKEDFLIELRKEEDENETV